MMDDLRSRRRETYELLYRHGVPYGETVSRIADQYGVAESTVKSDISNLSDWVGELDVSLHDGLLRVRKIRDQHQELEQVALEARRDEDFGAVIRARKAIVQAIETEDRMARRLGITDEAPVRVEVTDNLDPKDEELLEEFCGLEGGAAVDLEDWE